jgi:hypothetical protein
VLIGGDTGEGQAGNGHNLPSTQDFVLAERCVVRLVLDRNSTLLGPERTTVPVEAGGCLSVPGMTWPHIPLEEAVSTAPRFGVGRIWLWVGCWLRIAQWTRASCFLWLSCQGRTVDALAPGADEGRGRPR